MVSYNCYDLPSKYNFYIPNFRQNLVFCAKFCRKLWRMISVIKRYQLWPAVRAPSRWGVKKLPNCNAEDSKYFILAAEMCSFDTDTLFDWYYISILYYIYYCIVTFIEFIWHFPYLYLRRSPQSFKWPASVIRFLWHFNDTYFSRLKSSKIRRINFTLPRIDDRTRGYKEKPSSRKRSKCCGL